MKERRERNFRILEFRENKFDIIGDVHGCYDELMELIENTIPQFPAVIICIIGIDTRYQ